MLAPPALAVWPWLLPFAGIEPSRLADDPWLPALELLCWPWLEDCDDWLAGVPGRDGKPAELEELLEALDDELLELELELELELGEELDEELDEELCDED